MNDLLGFEPHELSGDLNAHGRIGHYWIDEQAWVYLLRVSGDPAGPITENLGTFTSVGDAISAANRLEYPEQRQPHELSGDAAA